jgi:glycosidase
MKWHDGDADLTDFHRRLVSLRAAEPALRAGSVDPLSPTVSDTDASNVAAYERTAGEDRLLVVVNFGAEAATVRFDGDATTADGADPTLRGEMQTDRKDLLSGENVATGDGGVRVEDCVVVRRS